MAPAIGVGGDRIGGRGALRRVLWLTVVAVLAWLFTATCIEASEDVVWQLGETGVQGDFLPLHPTRPLDGLDPQTHVLLYRVSKAGVEARPLFPEGLADLDALVNIEGKPSSDQRPTRAIIEWQEDALGWREFQVMFPAGTFRDLSKCEQVSYMRPDNFGDDLRIAGPDGTVARFQFPFESKDAPLVFWCRFQVAAGVNRLEIRPTLTFGIRGWEALRLVECAGGGHPLPVIELSTPAFNHVYFEGDEIPITIRLFNLEPGDAYTCHWEVKDCFGRVVESGSREVSPSQKGQGELKLTPSGKERGYFEVAAWLTDAAGKAASLGQCIDRPTLPFVRLAKADPISAADAEGRCGMQVLGEPGIFQRVLADQWAAMIRNLGGKWVRAPGFDWRVIEPRKGEFHWEQYDGDVDLLARHGLRMMPMIWTTPDWAKADPEAKTTWSGWYEVPRMEDWADFMEALVSRYKDRIKDWEIINEPMHHCGMYQPEAYLALMKVTREVVRRVDPEAKIVVGCQGEELEPLEWTRKFYQLGGGETFDIANVHYVGLREAAWHGAHQELLSLIPGRRVWDTEIHLASNSTMEQEAVDLVRAYTREAAWGIEKTFYHCGFRLMSRPHEADLATPLMAAHRTVADQLDGAKALYPMETGTLGQDIESHTVVRRDGTTLLAVWNNAGFTEVQRNWFGTDTGNAARFGTLLRDVSIPVGSSALTLIDMMDNERALAVEDGAAHLRVGKEPVFVAGLGRSILLGLSVLSVAPQQVALMPGQSEKISVTVRNVDEREATFDVKAAPPAGWTFAMSEDGSFTLKAGERKVVWCTVRAPDDAGRGLVSIPVRVDLAEKRDWTPAAREVVATVVEQPPGSQLLTGEWAEKGVRFSEGGGLALSDPVEVYPGETYAVVLEAKGEASIRAELVEYAADGKAFGDAPTLLSTAASETAKRASGIYAIRRGATQARLRLAAEGAAEADSVRLFLVPRVFGITPAALEYCVEGTRAVRAPVVDGDLAEWQKVPAAVLDRREQVRKRMISGTLYTPLPYPEWKGPKDLSARAWVEYDEKNLYLACRVWDDDLHTDLTSAKPPELNYQWVWEAGSYYPEDDHVVFSFHPRGGPERDFFLIVFDGLSAFFVIPKEQCSWQEVHPSRLMNESIRYAARKLSDGIAYEAAIPLSELPTRFAAGDVFDYQVLATEKDGDAFRGHIAWTPHDCGYPTYQRGEGTLTMGR